MDIDEQELGRRFLQGDRAAWNDLYLKHHDPLQKFVRNLSGMSVQKDRVYLVEDIVSEAFEKAWDGRATFNPQLALFSTWLYTIAKNLGMDALRRRRKAVESVRNKFISRSNAMELSGTESGFSFGKGEEQYIPVTRKEKAERFRAEEERRLLTLTPSVLPRSFLYERNLVPCSKKERAIIDMMLVHTSRKDIARNLNMSAAALDTAICRIKKKFSE